MAEAAEVSLADYRGSWVVLFFYPRDFTFVCPTELVAFAELSHEFAAEPRPSSTRASGETPRRRCARCRRSAPASSARRTGGPARRP